VIATHKKNVLRGHESSQIAIPTCSHPYESIGKQEVLVKEPYNKWPFQFFAAGITVGDNQLMQQQA